MSIGITTATCFGKIPSRGDFVKGSGQHQLIAVLDRWVSQGMERISEDPRWKQAYDDACPVDFAFIGARSRLSVAGHLRPSVDSSGRRFPFIAAATVERDDALMFRCAPAGLGRTYAAFAEIAAGAIAGDDFAGVLSELEGINCGNEFEVATHADPLGNYVRRNTLSSLADQLGGGITSENVRRTILSIGLLMRQVAGQSQLVIDKELTLPLPVDERNRPLVAGLWLYLLTAFLRRTGVELQIVMQRRAERPLMIVGFNGASSLPLIASMLPDMVSDRLISLVDPEWIDDQPELARDYGVAKLVAYLAQPGISLEQAIVTFREVFLGE